jgi:hypothetical protein
MQIEFDATVLGGLPVNIVASFCGDSFQDLIVEIKHKRAKWIETKLSANEHSRLVDQAYEVWCDER